MAEIRLMINRFFEGIPGYLEKNRWKAWLCFVLVTALLGAGVGKFQLELSMVSFFREGEPVKKAYDQFRAIFGGDEVVYIVYEAKDGNVFSPQSLKAIKGIQEELLNFRLFSQSGETSSLNHITDVKTLINASYLETKEGALISRDFIGNQIPQSEKDVEWLQKAAQQQSDYPKRYFSEDFRFGGIIIKTDFNAVPISDQIKDNKTVITGFDDEAEMTDFGEIGLTELPDMYSEDYLPKFKKTRIGEYVPFMEEISAIIKQPQYSDFLKFYPVGNPPLMSYAFRNMTFEMGLIMLGCLVLIIVVLWILFRSFSAVLWPIIIVVFSIIWVMGTIGWSGLAMTEMYNVIVFLVLAVGVGDAIHILSGYLFYRNKKRTHREAIQAVYKKSGLACFLTSITTSLGLLSMIFIPIVPLQRFAVFAAIGVMYAFVITIFILPLMLDIWSPVSKKKALKISSAEGKEHLIQLFIRRFEKIIFLAPWKIILLFSVASVILVIGSLKIRVESNSIENLKDSVPLKDAYKLVDKYMGGTGNLEVLVDSGQVDGFKDPALLQAVDDLQSYVESNFPDIVIKTLSLSNVTKDSFKALNEGRQEKYIIPEDPRLLAQTLFLFESANSKDRRQLVSDDYRLVRIGINSKNIGSIKGLELMNAVDSYINQHLKPLKNSYPNLKVTTTGQLPLQLKLMDYISWSQVRSFAVALGAISVILLVVLGSLKIGFIAIIPNLLPIVTAFGVMGYFDMALDVHTLLVVPIIIGIAVDDTIHFLTHFRLEMQSSNDVKQSIIHAYREAGQAIIFTSLVLSIGFLVFLFSSNKGFSYFGILSAVSIITATLADLILLPALLYVTNQNRSQRGRF
ncbi:MMPL family transporter [bacterium]|nr:MMPL family transporter [bacterium]